MNTDKMLPLKKFAEANAIGYRTAYRHWQNGLLEGIKLPTGTILVKGWKQEKEDTHKDDAIIFLRSRKEDNAATIISLKELAKENNINITDIIIWNGLAFQENPHLEEIIKNGIKNIVTLKRSDLLGINHNSLNLLLTEHGWNIIELEPSDNLPAMILGIVQASSRMAKAAVGMHGFKKDIAHYNNNLLS